MFGIVVSIAVIFILIRFWMNQDINIKWKIILTATAFVSKLVFPGIWSIIGTSLVLIIMILMLRWNGEKIR